ncbi:hypothetical protein EP10_002407 [Geobacillus icigianus]|uniref:OsmC family peroxiredoxin n=1 Tax=Geobacillus icigianus TaxID=1430331 RepID=A0ABU6BI38_9BACL|nr:hypothetical protein [Geobacillus icigianus]
MVAPSDNPINMVFIIDIDSPSDPKNVQALMEHVERVCPVKDTLRGMPTVVITLKRKRSTGSAICPPSGDENPRQFGICTERLPGKVS